MFRLFLFCDSSENEEEHNQEDYINQIQLQMTAV